MELYVVVSYADYGYEGYSEPTVLGVYTTFEMAECESEKYNKINNDPYDCIIIKKIKVNKSIC